MTRKASNIASKIGEVHLVLQRDINEIELNGMI